MGNYHLVFEQPSERIVFKNRGLTVLGPYFYLGTIMAFYKSFYKQISFEKNNYIFL